MVVGTGLLAKTFEAYNASKDILVFASGVSNSKETDPKAFKREFDLLKATNKAYPNAKLVYFSTVSITDASVNTSAYVQHKIMLENYITKHVNSFLILRTSNVVGAIGNPNTIMNFLVKAINEERPISIWSKAERNMIDVDDVFYIVDNLLMQKTNRVTINVATRNSVSVQSIVEEIEVFLGKKAIINSIEKGNSLPIDTSSISNLLFDIEAKSGNEKMYLKQLLIKYY
jgi:nucleoside-diphosphate-sugar epimerase